PQVRRRQGSGQEVIRGYLRNVPVVQDRRPQRPARQGGGGLEHAPPGHGEIMEFGGIPRAGEAAGYPDDRDGLAVIPPTVHCPPSPRMDSSVGIGAPASPVKGNDETRRYPRRHAVPHVISPFAPISSRPRPQARSTAACRRRGNGRMCGTCAILCACVPSGCFLPSRADLPSLARLPLVSRGVFIAGDYHSQGPDRINGEETMTAAESADLAQRYDPRDVQEK